MRAGGLGGLAWLVLAVADGHALPGDPILLGAGGSATPAYHRTPSTQGQGGRIEALVSLAQGGDAEAFAQIYDCYVDVVYRYLFHRVGSHALAEDLTSETFLRALRRLHSFTWQGRDLGAWLVTIARNLAMDHFKSARFRLEVTTADLLEADRADEGIEDTVLARLHTETLIDAVRRLKPEQQECIALRFLQDLSVAETAEILGRSEGAVKQLQLRAVRALAKMLAVEEP